MPLYLLNLTTVILFTLAFLLFFLSRLQTVQNTLARVVLPSVKRTDHNISVLKNLQWLPVSERITFKIALLTFKALSHKQPFNLHELLVQDKDY